MCLEGYNEVIILIFCEYATLQEGECNYEKKGEGGFRRDISKQECVLTTILANKEVPV